MKISNDRLLEIEEYLTARNILPEVTNPLVVQVFEELILDHPTRTLKKLSRKSRVENISYMLNSIKRDLLKLAYKHNNMSAKGIKAGYVYLITNPAWPEMVKVGSAIDVIDRLNSYQTYSPYRDYKLEKYFLTDNRLQDEKELLSLDPSRTSEWISVPLKSLISEMKLRRDSYRPTIKPEWVAFNK